MEGETRYARSGDLHIAYQLYGDGPVDLLLAPGYLSHLEQNQWWPGYRHFLERLGSFSRVILFDRRGSGLSDRILALGSFEELLDDIKAVLDAASSERAALFGLRRGRLSATQRINAEASVSTSPRIPVISSNSA